MTAIEYDVKLGAKTEDGEVTVALTANSRIVIGFIPKTISYSGVQTLGIPSSAIAPLRELLAAADGMVDRG